MPRPLPATRTSVSGLVSARGVLLSWTSSCPDVGYRQACARSALGPPEEYGLQVGLWRVISFMLCLATSFMTVRSLSIDPSQIHVNLR